MRNNWKRRLLYLASSVVVIVLGLASRHYGRHLPAFFAEYAGDTLWALMVFFLVSSLVPRLRVSSRAGIAIAFAYAVEISQLYHAPWIDAVRQTRLGGLILGFGFLATDLVCYASGIAIGAFLDSTLLRKRNTDRE